MGSGSGGWPEAGRAATCLLAWLRQYPSTTYLALVLRRGLGLSDFNRAIAWSQNQVFQNEHGNFSTFVVVGLYQNGPPGPSVQLQSDAGSEEGEAFPWLKLGVPQRALP